MIEYKRLTNQKWSEDIDLTQNLTKKSVILLTIIQ